MSPGIRKAQEGANRQPVRGTSLEQRMNASGGVRAGAHPEFGKPTPLDRMAGAVQRGAALVREWIKSRKKKGASK